MTKLMLGRLPATRPHGLRDLSAYSKGRLPAPPAQYRAPQFDVRMDLNDTYGDCTIAGVDHLLGVWNAETGVNDARPDDATIKSTYFGLTGGADAGLNEADVLQTWHQQGLFGNKIDGYAPVDPKDIVGLHQAIAFYGGAYLGIACQQSAQQDFAAGQPWKYDPSSPIEGGHCIVAVGYDSGGVYCATWGDVAYVTYPFMAHFLEEIWAIVSDEFAQKRGDVQGIDLETLQADLAAL